MIYLWDENVDFYDNLENKSKFLNEYIGTVRKLQAIKPEDIKSTEFEELVKKLDGKSE